MIEDSFGVNDISGGCDDMTVNVTCIACKHVFNVYTGIIGAKNCTHALGKSITVTCPNCKVSATSTVKESKVKLYTKAKDKLIRELMEGAIALECKFRLKSLISPRRAVMECTTCGNVFEADKDTQENVKITKEGATLICNKCDTHEFVTKESNVKALKLLDKIKQLNQISRELQEINRGDNCTINFSN